MKLRILLIVIVVAESAFSLEIVAHRGYFAKAPENTVAAFKAAWDANADACELDLHLTSDDKIIVCHDKDTKRTTSIMKVIAKSTQDELRILDAGLWKGSDWKGEKLPTLDESISTIPQGRQRFFLEIKCGPEVVPALTREMKRWQSRADQLAFISFDYNALTAAKKAMPWMQCYLLSGTKDKAKMPRTLEQIIAMTQKGGLDGVDLGLDWPWSGEMVKKLHAEGLKVYAYTANKQSDIERLVRAGVDGITTDDPVLARKLTGKS